MTACLLFLLLAADPVVTEASTAHYEIRAESIDAAEVGRLLEAQHAHLTEFFGRAPEQRLRVEVYANLDAHKAALARDHQSYLGGGGYFAPGNGKAYLAVQPSDYYTRQLILHETTHQFHCLASSGGKLCRYTWYVEGLAEYFGMHNWDGQTLESGVVPAISLEDYPAKALEQFDEADRDLEAILCGRRECQRPLAWALVHFLAHRYPRQFAALSLALDDDRDPLAAWKQIFGRAPADLAAELRRWIADHAQPWSSVWNSWQQTGRSIEGRSDVVALAVLKQTPQRLEAEMDLLDGNLKAGLTFGYHSPKDFFMLVVFAKGWAWVVHHDGSTWKTLLSQAVPVANGCTSVALDRSDGKVVLRVNGEKLTTLTAEGQVGLNVDHCRVRFHVRLER